MWLERAQAQELTNYSNIARECGVDSKTVKEYYQILADTLLGDFVLPFSKRPNRQIITKAPKFYLFDVGVAGFLCKRHLAQDRGEEFGKAFEHYIFTELNAHRSYNDLHYDIRFWRTKTGLEVDFILGDAEVAIEVKGGNRVDAADLKAIKAFTDEYRPGKVIVVANESSLRNSDQILIMPWRRFLDELWAGKIL